MRKAHVHLLGSIQSVFLYIFILTSCIFSLFILTGNAAGETGAEISLAWDQNTEPDLKGYKIYYKTGSSGAPYDGTRALEGGSPLTILVEDLQSSSAPSYKLTGLLHGVTYYLALTAVSNENVESEYSNEVSVTTNTLVVNQTPTANSGTDQVINEGAIVHLNGSNSSDPDHNISSYAWRQISGPTVDISNHTQAEATFTAPDVNADGASLMFELTVTDAGGLSDTDTCIVNVSWLNIAPTADAGDDQCVSEGQVVTLSGDRSTDVDGGLLEYQWAQTSGSAVTLTNANTSQPYFIAPQVDESGASVTFSLQVTDGGGLTSSDTCTVNVSWLNEAPTAAAGDDQTAVLGDTVLLDGTGSFDPENALETYAWVQKSGPVVSLLNSTSAQASFVAPDTIPDGSALFFELTVTDLGGLKANDTCVVEIKAPVKDKTNGNDSVKNNTNDDTAKDDNSSNAKGTNNGVAGTKKASASVPAADNTGDEDKNSASTGSQKDLTGNTMADGQPVDPVAVPTEVGKEDELLNDAEGHSDNTGDDDQKAASADPEKELTGNTMADEQSADPVSVPTEAGKEDELLNDAEGQSDNTGDDDQKVASADSEKELTGNTMADGKPVDPVTVPTEVGKEDEPLNDAEGQPDVVQTVENAAPYQPEPRSPFNGDVVSTPFNLTTADFMDPEAGDSHLKTQWQIFDKTSGSCVLNIMSESYLTTVAIPKMMLNEDASYYWRARFFDNHGNASEWSKRAGFTTPFSGLDTDDNGVIDTQEPDITVDMDKDMIPDIEQEHIRSIVLPDGQQHIGLSIENSSTVNSILNLTAIDPATASLDIAQEADVLPYGLINFKLEVCNAGDVATVTVFFETPAPVGSKWIKYDQVKNLWVDYTNHATFSNDRMSVTLEFKDGGYGDDDGVANGIIVDPSGLEVVEEDVVQISQVESAGSESVSQSGGSGGGGGCFIASTSEEGAGALPFMISIGLFLGALAMSFFKQGEGKINY